MKHSDLLRDNRFLVYMGTSKYSFEKVSGLEKSYATEIYNEGGVDEPHLLKGKQTELQTLKLEHGVRIGTSGSSMDNKMKPGKVIENIQVIALGKDMKPSKEFFITQAVLTGVEVGDFDASGESVLVESFTMQYYDLVQSALR